jgi:hypothetical protein
VVLTVIAIVAIVFVRADSANVLGVVTGVVGVIGSIVGAYFGVKIGSTSASQQANAAQIMALHVPPEKAPLAINDLQKARNDR